MTGRILKIAHQAGGAGPGLRSVFVLAGCGLHCRYCPCPNASQSLSGRKMTAEECAYTLFPYDATLRRGGGVTIAGGSVNQEAPFALEFLSLLKERGYHTALMTSGDYREGEEDGVERILRKTDMVIVDIKALTEEGYAMMGGSLARVLAFLNFAEAAGCAIRLRMMIVPGENDTEAAMQRLKRMTAHLLYLENIELVPYRRALFPGAKAPDCPDETIERLQAYVS